jgi:hypothetical protein
MSGLWTRDGVPLTVRGDRVYQPDGDNFGYIKRDTVFTTDGDYCGTIVGDRLIYRSTQSARISSPRAPSGGTGGSGRAHRGGTGAWGDEPDIDAS